VKAKVEEESGASNLEFSDYEYYYSYSIYDFLNFKAKSMKRSEADVLASVFFENNMPRPSYYCFF